MATFLALALVCAQSPAAPPARETAVRIDVTAILEPIRAQAELAGLVGAIVTGQGLQSVGATGLRRRGNTTAITVDDEMHLGSCAESMTATLCALLVKKETLHWDTRLNDAFATLIPDPHASWSRVTLADLLVHRGGVAADVEPAMWRSLGIPSARAGMNSATAPGMRVLLAKGILHTAPIASPGAKFVHSSSGFVLAGTMVERAASKPWEELLTSELFQPLGMTDTGFGVPGGMAALTQPRGHDGFGNPVEPGSASEDPLAFWPAVSVHCSVPDWARFVALHLRGERDGGLGLPPSDFVRLHAPVRDASEKKRGHAMGWTVAQRAWCGRVLTQDGSSATWTCFVLLVPEKGVAFLTAANQGGEKARKACELAEAALLDAWREATGQTSE